MESYVADNLDITIWGAGIHAQGTTAGDGFLLLQFC
jgi:hypothetical protein